MQKALLMSILVVTVLAPILVSRDTKPKRGMRRLVLLLCAFIALWGYVCRHYYYQLG
jgi:hypothetical protein